MATNSSSGNGISGGGSSNGGGGGDGGDGGGSNSGGNGNGGGGVSKDMIWDGNDGSSDSDYSSDGGCNNVVNPVWKQYPVWDRRPPDYSGRYSLSADTLSVVQKSGRKDRGIQGAELKWFSKKPRYTSTPINQVVIRHMPGQPLTCLCPGCKEMRDAMEDGAFDEPFGTDAVMNSAQDARRAVGAGTGGSAAAAVAGMSTPPRASRTTHTSRATNTGGTSRALVALSPMGWRGHQETSTGIPKVTPTKAGPKTTGIDLPIVISNAEPQGLYSSGFSGPDSVLSPKGFGDFAANDKELLDDMKVQSGVLKLVTSASQVNIPSNNAAMSRAAKRRAEEEASDQWKQSLADMGIEPDNVVAGTSQFLSSVVQQALLDPMNAVGMHNVANMSDYVQMKEHGLTIAGGHKHDFFFVPLMLNGMQLSEVNKLNKKEFFFGPNGQKYYNRSFWQASLDIKQKRGGAGSFSTLDLGMYQPLWTIPEAQRQDHLDALEFMRHSGPVVKGSPNVCLLSVKNAYAHYFLQGMSSGLVASARMNGYQPLWLIRQCLLQRSTTFGRNGWQFSTMDMQPKSYIALAGFCKGSEEGGDLKVITLTNRKDNFLALSNGLF